MDVSQAGTGQGGKSINRREQAPDGQLVLCGSGFSSSPTTCTSLLFVRR